MNDIDATKLMGELEGLLDTIFLNACYMGGMYKANPAPALTAFTLLTAKGETPYNSSFIADAVLCHDALSDLINQGTPLSAAAGMARRKPVVRDAFERIQNNQLDHLLQSMEEK